MRRTIVFLCLVLIVQLVYAQRSEKYMSSSRLFYEGKAMYDDKNYAGCIDKINQYQKQPITDPDLLQEAEFFVAASAFRQGRKDAVQLLKDYLDTYPEAFHYDEVCFIIGSGHFEEKDYAVAMYWLNRSNLNNLSLKDQEDYAYRMAFSALQTNKKDEARRLFGLLRNNSDTYHDVAIYYSAYIDYSDGNYSSALSLFSQLKDNKEFQQDVLYYIAQINFIQGRYIQTIKEGVALLDNYPHHKFNVEIQRIVGLSFYNESDYTNATKYLAQCAQSGGLLQQEDLYALGISYYNLKNYQLAANYFVKSNPENNALGQNSYLFLGQSYLKLQDEKNALMAFESASRMDFDLQAKETAMYNYAMLLHKNSISAFGESVTVLENFLNTYPQSIYTDKVNDCLVDVYLTTKNYSTALQSINKIKNPGNKILEAKQKIYYYLGTVDYTNTNYQTAVDNFTKAIAMGHYAPEERSEAIYWRAESYYKQGQYDLAIKDYNTCLQASQLKSKLAVSSRYSLGYCHFKKGQYPSALSEFKVYVSQETDKATPNLADAYARIGDCYFNQRQFTEAEKAYTQSATLQPSFADYATFQKGFIMGLLKNYRGKVTQMDRLIESFPNSRYLTDAIYEKGRANVMMENNDAAIKAFEELLSQYPQSALARKAGIQLGLLHFNQNDLQKSVVAYKHVIDNYPGSEEARVSAQDLKSVYVELNDIQGYANYINTKGGINKFEITEQDSLTYLVAEKSFIQGDEKRAQLALESYLKQFPEGAFFVNAHNYLGSIYYNQRDYSKSKTEFQYVIDAGNTEFLENALLKLAEIQYLEKDYKKALVNYHSLKQNAKTKANEISALLGIMRSGYYLNDYADIINAADNLQKESNLSPEVITESLYYRGKAYLALNEEQKALPELKKLATDVRTVYGAEAKYLLSQYYFDNKEPTLAEKEVLEYIQMGTPHTYWLARSFILLSDVYASQNDMFKAKQYLESLQHNYKNTDDDIKAMIEERMNRINN